MLNNPVTALVCALAMAVLAWPASAQFADGDRTLEHAGTQATITQQLAKDTLLVALNINREQSLGNLEVSRAQFDRVLEGLRDGDPMLGLSRAANGAFLEEIDRAHVLWRQMDLELRAGLADGAFTPDQVVRITDFSTPLLNAMHAAAELYVKENLQGQLTSMLVVAADMSGRQRTLVERMTKELLLIAYGLNADMHRALLRESETRYAETLNGLMNGDIDLRLLPAPTPAISDELAGVERIWLADLQPIVGSAIDGVTVERSVIGRLPEINALLFEDWSRIITLYQRL